MLDRFYDARKSINLNIKASKTVPPGFDRENTANDCKLCINRGKIEYGNEFDTKNGKMKIKMLSCTKSGNTW